MYKKIALVFLISWTCSLMAQDDYSHRFPVFPNCETRQAKELEMCFYNEVQAFVFRNFEVPEAYKESRTMVRVLFEVDENGSFKVQYVDAPDQVLISESNKVFEKFPKIKPATYNGKPTYSKYTIRIAIPLQDPSVIRMESEVIGGAQKTDGTSFVRNKSKELTEYDSIVYKKFRNPQFESHLNVPFSHSYYAQFDPAMNQVGTNNHTSSKPYTYAEVNRYYDLSAANAAIMMKKKSWWGRKLFNENTVAIQGEDYWFTMNPIFDLQLGKSDPGVSDYTYVNTRGLQIRGGLGSQINFTTTIFESQGRFADYFNRYAESIAPAGGNPAIIPGVGIAKEFKTDAYDFPLAEANLTFAPGKFFDLQLGYGRNFIGDGYRSLLLGDGASPYPYFKINTKFWKIKYTNLYTWLKDVRPEVTVDRTYASKYAASHYLSWNATKRLNIGFFESVIWTNQNNRGFDFNFVNPIIFYRTVEFSSSSRSGNALLGLTSKYKWNNSVNLYGQFLLDEFSLGDIKGGNKSWKNKFGYQLGVKYYHAFTVRNLFIQAEYNHVRPYVYAHSNILTNYGHNNQSLGHQWGGNFREFVGIARYHYGRYFADAKFTVGQRGLDFSNSGPNSNYGGDIYRSYDDDRFADTGVAIAQGNKTNIFIADIQAGYLVNPSANMKLFGSLIYRNFDPSVDTALHFKESTTWFSIGLRCDIFNWYFDY